MCQAIRGCVCCAQVWNMKDFGLQATQRITASSDPLRALTEMAQNFPNLAAALSRVSVPDALRMELRHHQQVVQGGASHSILRCLSHQALAHCKRLMCMPDRIGVSMTTMLAWLGARAVKVAQQRCVFSNLFTLLLRDTKKHVTLACRSCSL